ncbi:[protein release factor]-glutamine N5-methyltransferase [Hydromonas duriensis]|uniref:Release factor glutamine methyltransferase n=2 Tax=Hydromonas duriensis TaxID=1527608 RepID=A0A4R6Y1J4_9BURK|nr:peptide chain release factor N(5)-glutamine methyltransferase [Hydromonas duriensis]TDR29016.1 [protein release factor]-glutamine N5-methyltransferase [Hydromonas duriensis]
MLTIQHLIQHANVEPLEARMLMQYVTGYSRASLISRGHDVLPASQAQQFTALVARRVQGEPMAYIIGQREFYGRPFKVTPDVLIPRPDTETLIEHVLQHCGWGAEHALNVLDMGTGSGAIAVTLACERPHWRVSALDISNAALSVAAENAEQLGAQVTFMHSDWFSAWAAHETHPTFDIIVSNPPYVAALDVHLQQGDVRFEPRMALTDEADGLRHYKSLVQTAPDYLKAGGQLWFEHGYDQAQAVREALMDAGFIDVNTIRDLAGHERVSGGTIRNK